MLTFSLYLSAHVKEEACIAAAEQTQHKNHQEGRQEGMAEWQQIDQTEGFPWAHRDNGSMPHCVLAADVKEEECSAAAEQTQHKKRQEDWQEGMAFGC